MTTCPVCARDIVVENGLVTCPNGCVHEDLDQACARCGELRAEITLLRAEAVRRDELIEKGHAQFKDILDAFKDLGIVAPNGRTAAEDIRAIGAECAEQRAKNAALVAEAKQLQTQWYAERTALVGELRAAIALINDKEWRKPEAQIELRRLREIAGL